MRRATQPRAVWSSLVFLLAVGCLLACTPQGPRELTPDELELVKVEGRVSKWLPSRFSGTVDNGSSLELAELELEIHGKTVAKAVRIAPGASRRFSLQYLFPEDDAFGDVDPAAVQWRLVGATGSPPHD